MFRPIAITMLVVIMVLAYFIAIAHLEEVRSDAAPIDTSIRQELKNHVGHPEADIVLVLHTEEQRMDSLAVLAISHLARELQFAQLRVTWVWEAQVTEFVERIEKAPRLPDKRRTGAHGVVRVDFCATAARFDGQVGRFESPHYALEYSHHGRVSVFLDRICARSAHHVDAVGRVALHGVGHALGLDDPGHQIPFIAWSPTESMRQLFGHAPDIMMQGNDPSTPNLSLAFDRSRNQRIIRALTEHGSHLVHRANVDSFRNR